MGATSRPASPRFSSGRARSAAMRASNRAQTGNSAGRKNMPSLVRASFTSLAPVLVSTVSERARRVRARAISSAHSSSASSEPKTTIRGWLSAMRTATSWPSTRTRGAAALMRWPGIGLGGSAFLATRVSRSLIVVSRAARATFSSQPLAFIASSTTSGECPAAAWATIQRRNSGVTGWALIGAILPERQGSAEVAAAADEAVEQKRVIDHPRGEQVHHRCVAFALALPLAVDGEQRRPEQGLSLRIGDLRPDDDVDGAGLVLEGDEDRALGRLGPLPVRDEAAGPRQPAVREGAQARGRLDPEFREPVSKQRQRVALQRQAERAVVG